MRIHRILPFFVYLLATVSVFPEHPIRTGTPIDPETVMRPQIRIFGMEEPDVSRRIIGMRVDREYFGYMVLTDREDLTGFRFTLVDAAGVTDSRVLTAGDFGCGSIFGYPYSWVMLRTDPGLADGIWNISLEQGEDTLEIDTHITNRNFAVYSDPALYEDATMFSTEFGPTIPPGGSAWVFGRYWCPTARLMLCVQTVDEFQVLAAAEIEVVDGYFRAEIVRPEGFSGSSIMIARESALHRRWETFDWVHFE